MWIFISKTQEWLPFDNKSVAKVFKDAQNGWAIKYHDGSVAHIDDETYRQKLMPILSKPQEKE